LESPLPYPLPTPPSWGEGIDQRQGGVKHYDPIESGLQDLRRPLILSLLPIRWGEGGLQAG